MSTSESLRTPDVLADARLAREIEHVVVDLVRDVGAHGQGKEIGSYHRCTSFHQGVGQSGQRGCQPLPLVGLWSPVLLVDPNAHELLVADEGAHQTNCA